MDSGPLPRREVTRIADLLLTRPARCGGVRVVAIDGPAGSGKTTVAELLRAELLRVELDDGGVVATVLHMDDLYDGWQALAGARGRELGPRLVEQVLEPLSRGAEGRFQRYDWFAGRFGPWMGVPVPDVLVVEGCGSGSLAAAAYLTLLVWLEAPAAERYQRAIARDSGFRPYWDAWSAAEQSYFADQGTRSRADVVVSTGSRQDAAGGG